MSTEFVRGIAVSARPDDPTTYDTELSAGWQIGAGINGGLLLATLGNALRSTLSASGGHLDPSRSAATTSPPRHRARPSYARRCCGPAVPLSTAAASLVQQDGSGASSCSGEVERIRALATYADLGALSTRRHSAG